MQFDSRQLDLLLGTFFEITSLLHSGREGADIFARVLDCTCELLDADRCALLLAHDGRVLKFCRARGASETMQREELAGTAAALGWMARERQPFLGAPGQWRFPAANEIVARSAGSLVCAPLVAKESHLGLLVAVRAAQPHGFDDRDLRLLTALANQTAIVIENADLYARLRHEAVTDGLTGIYNYKTLMQTLRTELRRAQRYSFPVTFVMVDVDHLKRYNDRFGHLAGSDVLAEVAQLLVANCRNTDVVGKYGGDEFAVILPQTVIAGAVTVAERMRAAIAQHVFKNVERGAITCSFGIAAFPEDGSDLHELISESDLRLFQAKRDGKNTLCATRPEAGTAGPPAAAAPERPAAPESEPARS